MPVRVIHWTAGVELDERPFKHRLGLVALATDHVSEPELSELLRGRDIAVYVSRVAYANPVTTSSLQAMAPDLMKAADHILPGEKLDALIFGCTAGTVAIGEARVVQSVHRAKPSVPVITPVGAAAAGLRAMGARRISILTACDQDTSLPIAAYFEEKEYTIDRLTCLGLTDDRDMARISRAEILRLARQSLDSGSEALYICGSALRAALIIPEVEKAIGAPVVSSNYAIAWNVLRLCGESAPPAGHLMQYDLPPPTSVTASAQTRSPKGGRQ